jgi:hypothetical protein
VIGIVSMGEPTSEEAMLDGTGEDNLWFVSLLVCSYLVCLDVF